VKKAMMVVAVGFAAVTFAGCEGEAAEDTVTVDVGTAAIEDNVDADDEEDPLPTVQQLVQYPPTTIVGEGSCSLTSDG
jgi:hypothetical protein